MTSPSSAHSHPSHPLGPSTYPHLSSSRMPCHLPHTEPLFKLSTFPTLCLAHSPQGWLMPAPFHLMHWAPLVNPVGTLVHVLSSPPELQAAVGSLGPARGCSYPTRPFLCRRELSSSRSVCGWLSRTGQKCHRIHVPKSDPLSACNTLSPDSCLVGFPTSFTSLLKCLFI